MGQTETFRFVVGGLLELVGLFLLFKTRRDRGFGQTRQAAVMALIIGTVLVLMALHVISGWS